MLLAALTVLMLAARALGECECGTAGAPCCDCAGTPLDGKCLFDAASTWCTDAGVDCADDGVCRASEAVVDASAAACGAFGRRCCAGGACAGALLCASGSCVDADAVLDASPCGLDGAECCGYYNDCDDDLVCAGGRCAAA